jgi:hypothetical protein
MFYQKFNISQPTGGFVHEFRMTKLYFARTDNQNVNVHKRLQNSIMQSNLKYGIPIQFYKKNRWIVLPLFTFVARNFTVM